MQPVSKFFSDIVKSVSSSGVQLIITMVSTPLMTRLYDPAAYTSFGVINMIATVAVGVGLLSLPNAYPIEKDPQRRIELVQTMTLMLVALVLFSVGSAIVMAALGTLELEAATLALLPVLILTFGIRQIMVSVATECAHFSSLSVGQIIEPATSRTGSIGLAILGGGNPVYILISVAAGHMATAITVAKMVVGRSISEWGILFKNRPHPITVIKRYSDFAIYNTPSQQAQPLAMLGIQLIIVAIFAHDMAGQYLLAISILTLPASVVALASAPVVYRDFIETDRTDPTQLAPYLKRAMVLYLAAGTLILSPIALFGEEIFKFIFSDVWGHAGEIASTLTIAYIGAFALTGVQSIFRVTRRLKTQFFLEVLTCSLALIAVAFSFKSMSFDNAIYYLAVIWTIRNIILLFACIIVTNEHADPTLRVP
jgi:O-antigen/teichoic acid export membrane protein